MKPTPKPLTLGDISRYCHVDRVTVQRWVKNALIPAYRTPGGHYRVPKEEFRKFLQKNKMPIYPEFFEDLPLRLLVVDQPLEEAQSLAEFLEAQQPGYEAKACATAKEAFFLLGQYRPEVAVLNLDLEGFGGPRACQEIRSLPESSLIRILALSAHASPDKTSRSDSGAELWLQKPARAEEVLQAIRSLLDPALLEEETSSRSRRPPS